MQRKEKLFQTLKRIDGRGYKAYNDIKGNYDFETFTLYVDHVQRDPFAGPSLLRVEVSSKNAAFPSELLKNSQRITALEDYIARAFKSSIDKKVKGVGGSGHSGTFRIDSGGQEVLERTCVNIHEGNVELRFQVGLPAHGRRVMGKAATTMFRDILPVLAESSCFHSNLQSVDVKEHVETYEDAEHIRSELSGMGLVAFIADGSILPRESGVSQCPLKDAVAFKSPDSMSVTIETPNHGPITGMGIRKGVTLVVGGGYHGKSTLLNALERGVYNHVPCDGRQFIVTDDSAVKIRAEDSRNIEKADISSFIHEPPGIRDTSEFSTENASGSTSQAANIIEAMEAGSKVLLFDEDTSATNFMIRDQRMQQLVSKEKEPITPFLDRIRELCTDHGVSTIMVMGGSGDYFDAADNVLMMDSYTAHDVTEEARRVADDFPVKRMKEIKSPFKFKKRCPKPDSIKAFKGRKLKLDSKGTSTAVIGRSFVDLSQVEQLVEESQTRTIAHAIHYTSKKHMDGKRTLGELLDLLEADINENGLDVLAAHPGLHPPNFARPRRFEIAAAINRLRTLNVEMKDDQGR